MMIAPGAAPAAAPGAGAKDGDSLQVLYKGSFLDGKVFDSSEKNGGKPLPVVLGRGQVIKGFENGLRGMKVGDKKKITIPPEEAYGAAGRPGIPPNSTLVFDLEVVAITPGQGAK